MKGRWHSFCVFLALTSCLSSVQNPSPFEYENICKHQFSQGCPVHESESWNCAKLLTNCSGDQRYHCLHNTVGEPFYVIHACSHLIKCSKGTIPIYDDKKAAVSCEFCRDGYYQPYDTWSDEAPECSKKHTCEKEGNKIECDTSRELHRTQDTYCRCDTRNNYVLTNWETRDMCQEWGHVTCYHHRCPDGEERLQNYTCAPRCPESYERNDKDICALQNENMTTEGSPTPYTSVITIQPVTQTSTPVKPPEGPGPVDHTALYVLIIVLIVALVTVLLILCYRFRKRRSSPGNNPEVLCCRFRKKMSSPSNSPEENAVELERLHIPPVEENGASQGNTSSTGNGQIIQKINQYYVTAQVAQFGEYGNIITTQDSPEPQTPEDCPSSSSRPSHDSQPADSLPPLPSSQGHISMDRYVSSSRDETHESIEETSRKVIE